MITGKDEKGKEIIDKWAHSIFFHLNLFIEASLRGDDLGKLMDTNIIILILKKIINLFRDQFSIIIGHVRTIFV